MACNAWSSGIGQNRETDEEHDKYCVEEDCQLARVKFDRDGERGSETPDVGNCNINIWDGSEQGLAWFLCSSEAEFISHLYVHIVLATDTEAKSECFAQLLQCWKHVETLSIQTT